MPLWFIFSGISASPTDDGYTFPTIQRGDVSARLSVHVEDAEANSGRGAAVRMTLTIDGPETLELQDVRLEDPTSSWQSDRAGIWSQSEGRTRWTGTFKIRQIKPGFAPLPAVTLRFRASPDAEWEDASWVDLLKEPRDGPEPEPIEMPVATVPSRERIAFGISAGLLVLLIAWRVRRRPVASVSESADQTALKELDALAITKTPPADFHDRLADIIRRFLTERYNVPALRQTSAELLALHADCLPPSQRAPLRELLECCDVARFAGANGSTEECRKLLELARSIVVASCEVMGELKASAPQPTSPESRRRPLAGT